jgi:hypothetical protein
MKPVERIRSNSEALARSLGVVLYAESTGDF